MPTATARILLPTPRNLEFLARRLQAGEIVAVPTETVYGLAANALDPAACRKIFRAKGRPTSDPLIVHVHSVRQLSSLCHLDATALKLAKAFWPGPLTLVLPRKPAVPSIVTAGLDTVAVRIPSHPIFRRLLRLAKLPLAAPSANPFGYISPTSSAHVIDNLGHRIGYVLEGGPCPIGIESTILDLRDSSRPAVLRPGKISASEIAQVLGRKVKSSPKNSRDAKGPQVAPGLLTRHYSPRTPVVLRRRLPSTAPMPGTAYLFLRKPAASDRTDVFWLDARGNLNGAARRLFAILRRIDRLGFNSIEVEAAPARDGIAAALNDRLRRAAAK